MPSGTRVETRAGRRVAASAGRGLRGRWAAWRLFAAAGRGEPSALDGVAEIAGRQAHRLRERALDTLAARLPVLLAAGDPGAREHAAGICRTASGPLLEALWGADTGPGTPLRSVLLGRDDVPPQPVVDTLWGECLRAPGTGPLDALVRWGRPASGGPEEPFSVIALGKDPDAVQDQDLAERLCDAAMADPRLAWICVEHGFAPADPVKRSAFFLLTGQPGQYRALDPDGSLLALAYASRPDGERPRIREAMLAAGELDLVRVVAGDRRARLPDMSDGEARYLGEQLAGRGEWEELWSIVQDVPLPTGVELFRLFDRWAPRDQDSRRVFEMFRETPPAMVSIAVESMRWYWMTAALHATFDIKGGVRDMSFAPDGPLLAAVSEDGVAGVLDLRTRRLVQRYEGFTAPPGRVLHTGNDTLIAGIGADGARPGRGLVRCGADGVRTLHDAGPVTSLALPGEDGSFAAGTRDGRLLLGSPGGESVDARHVTALGLDAGDWPRAVAAHPGSGRLAVLGRKLAVTFAMTGEATAAAVEQPLTRAGFPDADSLICADRHGTVTRLRGPRWRRTARTHYMGLAGLGALPGAGRAVALDREGGLHFLDAASLATLDTLRPPSPRSPAGLTVSPRGEFLAVRYPRGGVELFDLRVRELPDLVRRPVAELVPRHLGTVATALTHTGPLMTSATQATLRLLHACLQHRFRYDIEIGDAVELSAGQYDVSL
ncbi:WD40 repeat domain-containing protein [Actinomadura welshii]